jgi:hypothetical protein
VEQNEGFPAPLLDVMQLDIPHMECLRLQGLAVGRDRETERNPDHPYSSQHHSS